MREFIRIAIIALLACVFSLISAQSYAADSVGVWQATTQLPYVLTGQVAFSYGNKVSIVGGSPGTGNSKFNVLSANPLVDGSISNWSTSSVTPTALIAHAVAQKNNYVYILGGLEENPGSAMGIVDKVFLGTLNPAGTAQSWQVVTPLPQGAVEGEAVVVGERIYFAGGVNTSGRQDEVYMASINSNGTLGSWSLVSNLPTVLSTFGMVTYKNRIYIIGGNNGSIRDEVYSASVNPVTGALSAWQSESSLIQKYADKNQTVIVGNTVLVVGGTNGVSSTDKVLYTTINPDGSLAPWQQSSSSLPQSVEGGALVFNNGYLYLLGGNHIGFLDTVYYAKFDSGALPVPLLKQTDPLWGGFTYDSANIWAPSDPTIGGWGCALTSAAMVFQYYGISKLPDGTIDLQPGTLNTWLKTQPDGYVGNGLVNWLALSRLSKMAKSVNPSFTAGSALEFSRFSGANKTQLAADLANKIPGILNVPGHFVVATGSESATFKINDPFFNRSDLTSYSNTFSSLSRFAPSNTDLSYVMAVVDSSTVDVNLKTASGSAVGESFVQDPLSHDGGTGVSGSAVKILLAPKPIGGDYNLNISSGIAKSYQVKIYLYDKDGNVKLINSQGVVGPGDSDSFLIKFSKDNSAISSGQAKTDFDSFINDINSLCRLGDLNKVNCLALLLQARTAASTSTKTKAGKIVVVALLKAIDTQIFIQKGRLVSNNAYNILHSDIQSLILSL